MNDALKDFYTSKWEDLNQIRQIEGISEPLLIAVPPEYGKASRRLLIVGQQTYGWSGYGKNAETDPIAWLMEGYAHFALGRDYYRSPFWQASHELYALLNPDGPPSGFLWSNLVKVDQDGYRPPEDVEEAVCQLGLLPAELKIICPNIVIFFTGPRYDARLCSTFPSLRAVLLDERIRRLEHPSLPYHAYRVPHPKYLRLSGQWDTLIKIVHEIGKN